MPIMRGPGSGRTNGASLFGFWRGIARDPSAGWPSFHQYHTRFPAATLTFRL
jgi:hypothetical protein